MAFNLMLPPEGNGTVGEQLAQLYRYLFALVGDLQIALDGLSGQKGGAELGASSAARTGIPTGMAAQETFNGIKALILRSSDILNAYTMEIEKRLVEKYIMTPKGSITTDTVAAIGQTNEWLWRRWKSGQIEMWGIIAIQADGESESPQITATLPFTLQNAVVSGIASDNYTLTWCNVSESTLTVQLCPLSASASNTSIRLQLQINGMVVDTESESLNGE